MQSDEELFREYLLRQKRDRLMAEAVVRGAARGFISGTGWAIITVFIVIAILFFAGKG